MEREEEVVVEINLHVLRDTLQLSPWERLLLRSATEQCADMAAKVERFAHFRRTNSRR
jgi:hypothetical protein